MPTVPKWYLPTAIAALLWNLLGCAAYLGDVLMSPEQLAALPPEQQALYAARPAWAVAATATAVWFGAAGSLGLVLRRHWALPLLALSLLGVIAQDLGLFVLSGLAGQVPASAWGLQGAVLAIAVALVWLARRAGDRAWLR